MLETVIAAVMAIGYQSVTTSKRGDDGPISRETKNDLDGN